jgi:hypothetical protein
MSDLLQVGQCGRLRMASLQVILQPEEPDESHQFCTSTASDCHGAADHDCDDWAERYSPVIR